MNGQDHQTELENTKRKLAKTEEDLEFYMKAFAVLFRTSAQDLRAERMGSLQLIEEKKACEAHADRLAKALEEVLDHPRMKSAPLAEVSDEWRWSYHALLKRHRERRNTQTA